MCVVIRGAIKRRLYFRDALFETILIDFALKGTGRHFKDQIKKVDNSTNSLAPSQRTLTEWRAERSERERQRDVREGERQGLKAGVAVGRFYTDNVQSLCMRLTGATAS